jgi:peptidoglycan/xylan/chitin deacetylase (PgdA/CDA1 family)
MWKFFPILFFSSALCAQMTYVHGGIVRGDSSQKEIALVFTGHDHSEGGDAVLAALYPYKATFFLTGDFYRSKPELVRKMVEAGHYMGAHSDRHLLYCSWEKRDSTLVSKEEFQEDIRNNHKAMEQYGLAKPKYYMPPYEWYNATISAWANEEGVQIVNFTPGTLSNADYTTPSMPNYRSSERIHSSILEREQKAGLSGFMLLIHLGTSPEREDKYYNRLPELINYVIRKGYRLVTVEELLKKRP